MGETLKDLLFVGWAVAVGYLVWVGLRLWLTRPRRVTLMDQLLGRGEAAVDRLRDRCGTPPDPDLRGRLAEVSGEAVTVLAELRPFAGRLREVERSLRHHPVDRLREQYAARHEAVDELPPGPLRAAREQGLQALDDQLEVAERLDTTRQTLLARVESAVLGLEGLDARVAELCVLSDSSTAEATTTDRLTELSDEVDSMRAGLDEARRVSTAVLDVDSHVRAEPARPARRIRSLGPRPADDLPPAAAPAAETRRRGVLLSRPSGRELRVAAALLVAVLAGSAAHLVGGGPEASTASTRSTGSAAPAGCAYKIAFLGGLTGLGAPQVAAARLAVREHNERHPCVTVATFDTNSVGALIRAAEIAGDPAIVGVVGPVTGEEVDAALPLLDGEGVPVVTGSASATALSGKGWRVFHRTVPTDADQAAAAVRYLDTVMRSRHTFVVVEDTPFGAGLAEVVQPRLGAAFAGKAKVDPDQKDYRKVIQRIVGGDADAVYFAGSAAGAGRFLNQLRPTTAIPLIGTDQLVYTTFFTTARDEATVDVVATCACVPPSRAEQSFRSRYAADFGEAPEFNAAEAYDAATVLLAGIAAGRTTRPAMLDWMSTYDAPGVAQHIRFDAEGDLAPGRINVWALTLKGQDIRAEQIIAE